MRHKSSTFTSLPLSHTTNGKTLRLIISRLLAKHNHYLKLKLVCAAAKSVRDVIKKNSVVGICVVKSGHLCTGAVVCVLILPICTYSDSERKKMKTCFSQHNQLRLYVILTHACS